MNEVANLCINASFDVLKCVFNPNYTACFVFTQTTVSLS